MPLTKQQLLIPRVLCIGGKDGEPNYPDSKFLTGEILIEKGDQFVSIDGTRSSHSSWMYHFQNLFKPIPWWYGRTVEEMPLYLKAKKTGVVIKPLSYTRNPEGAVNFAGEDFPTSLEWFAPADISDYQEYQKAKTVGKVCNCASSDKLDQSCPECFSI